MVDAKLGAKGVGSRIARSVGPLTNPLHSLSRAKRKRPELGHVVVSR